MQRRCRGVTAIHAASHVDHEETVAWISISMHALGSIPLVMVCRLAARGSAIIVLLPF